MSQKQTFTFSLPWWTHAYARTCIFFAACFGVEPDLEKISTTITNHIKATKV